MTIVLKNQVNNNYVTLIQNVVKIEKINDHLTLYRLDDQEHIILSSRIERIMI